MNYTEIAIEVAAGVPVSLAVAFGGILFGAILAIGVAAARISPVRALSGSAWVYLQLVRSMPMIALLFLLYYGLSQFQAVRESIFWPVLREPIWCAIIALSLKASAYISEVYRIGISSVPSGEILAARSFGFRGFRLYRSIIIPYATPVVLPAMSNEFVILVKASSLASLITLMDITGIAASIGSETFRPLAALSMAAVYYLIFNSISIALFRLAERKLKK
ncbi:ABC transporter permease subunit [Ensifer sp. ENS02]|uniref:ABC transporter permease subunit n=1 Tax=Ensifer sp. ENS02 TaxID=2769290 RepID=UPI00177DEE1C|nr:ABC transporter permease subunit [Ensifer sp. ENS02]MBD9524479.1 ABC transporter permease subunit [Ensifer sp. ENS02]